MSARIKQRNLSKIRRICQFCEKKSPKIEKQHGVLMDFHPKKGLFQSLTFCKRLNYFLIFVHPRAQKNQISKLV